MSFLVSVEFEVFAKNSNVEIFFRKTLDIVFLYLSFDSRKRSNAFVIIGKVRIRQIKIVKMVKRKAIS